MFHYTAPEDYTETERKPSKEEQEAKEKKLYAKEAADLIEEAMNAIEQEDIDFQLLNVMSEHEFSNNLEVVEKLTKVLVGMSPDAYPTLELKGTALQQDPAQIVSRTIGGSNEFRNGIGFLNSCCTNQAELFNLMMIREHSKIPTLFADSAGKKGQEISSKNISILRWFQRK